MMKYMIVVLAVILSGCAWHYQKDDEGTYFRASAMCLNLDFGIGNIECPQEVLQPDAEESE